MRRALVLLAVAAQTAAAASAPAAAATRDPATTSYATIGGDAGAPYSRLTLRPGSKRVVRDDLGATPRKGRLARRRSLMYFAQLSDFQLADEESPARAEVLDLANSPFTLAWRPQEALAPHTVDEVIRQVNRFDQSPIRNRTRRRARMALTITTGDSADSQQINEVKWVVRLLEGGTLNRTPASRTPSAARSPVPPARPPATPAYRTTTTCSSPAASTTPTVRRGRSAPGRATRVSWTVPRFRSKQRAWTARATSRSATTTARCRATSMRSERWTASPRAASSRSRWPASPASAR